MLYIRSSSKKKNCYSAKPFHLMYPAAKLLVIYHKCNNYGVKKELSNDSFIISVFWKMSKSLNNHKNHINNHINLSNYHVPKTKNQSEMKLAEKKIYINIVRHHLSFTSKY